MDWLDSVEPGAEGPDNLLHDPRLTLKLADRPNMTVPWRISGEQIMRAQWIVIMRFWLMLRTPKSDRIIAASDVFTLAAWMEFAGPSESKATDFRMPAFYCDGVSGDFRKELLKNVKSLEAISKKQRDVPVQIGPPKDKVKPVITGQTANEIMEGQVNQNFP